MTRKIVFLSLLLWLCCLCQPSFGQNPRRDVEILDFIDSTIRANYYDPAYCGIDLDAHFKSIRERLKKSKSNQESMTLLAASLLEFDDWGTHFLPPDFYEEKDPGWAMVMIGESCVINKVDSKSDAEKQGLKVGDVVLSVDGAKPLRKDLWKIEYHFRYLDPLKVRQLVVQSPGENPRVVTAAHTKKLRLQPEAVILRGHNQARQRNVEMVYRISDDVGLWKVPDLKHYEVKDIDQILEKIKGYKKLILDLRGNDSGAIAAQLAVLGCLFNRELKAYEEKARKKSKTVMIRPRRKGAFQGELVTLVDSETKAGAELIARVVQLEKRGKVVGDRTVGKVMLSYRFTNSYSIDPTAVVRQLSIYGVRVSIADLIMSDGKSLEGVGVQPDELLLPKPEDIVGKRDPVLSRAATMLGTDLDPAQAWLLLNQGVNR